LAAQHRSGEDPAASASRIGTYRLSASEKRIDFVKGTKDILDKGRVHGHSYLSEHLNGLQDIAVSVGS
jgi:hypothetical protein